MWSADILIPGTAKSALFRDNFFQHLKSFLILHRVAQRPKVHRRIPCRMGTLPILHGPGHRKSFPVSFRISDALQRPALDTATEPKPLSMEVDVQGPLWQTCAALCSEFSDSTFPLESEWSEIFGAAVSLEWLAHLPSVIQTFSVRFYPCWQTSKLKRLVSNIYLKI